MHQFTVLLEATYMAHVCFIALTCHLHFWHNGKDLLRATAVTQGWNEYRNKSQHRKLTLRLTSLPLTSSVCPCRTHILTFDILSVSALPLTSSVCPCRTHTLTFDILSLSALPLTSSFCPCRTHTFTFDILCLSA